MQISIWIGIGCTRGGNGEPPVITATSAPVVASADYQDTPADVVTAGSYESSEGTISSAVLTYLVNGSPEASSYDLQGGETLRVSELVTDSEGNTRTFYSNTVTVVYPAPVAAKALSDQSYDLDDGDKTVDASVDFTNAVGGTWSVSGAGASIDQSGVVTIPTDVELSSVTVTVTYTNSGGTDSSAFSVTVSEASSSEGIGSMVIGSTFIVAGGGGGGGSPEGIGSMAIGSTFTISGE